MEGPMKKNVYEKLIVKYARKGILDYVKICVRRLGPGFSEALSMGAKPINVALKYGHTKIAKYLLKKCSKEDIKTEAFLRPLRTAIQKNYFHFVKLMLRAGVPVNIHWKSLYDQGQTEKTTPLYDTVSKRQLKMVELLLEYGADPNLLSEDGALPLHFAIWWGSKTLVELLLKHGASINARNGKGETAVFICIERGRFMRLRYFLESHPERPVKNHGKLNEVLTYEILGKNGVINQLIEHGIAIFPGDIDNVMVRAIWEGNTEVVREQLKNVPDFENLENLQVTYLHVAIFSRRREIARLLLEAGANIHYSDKNYQSCIKYLIRKRDFNMIELLSELTKEGVLHGALLLKELIFANATDLVDAFLKSGIDRDIISAAVAESSYSLKLEMARVILRYNVDIDARNPKDKRLTLLHRFTISNNYEFVYQLLRSGASVFVPDENGFTPLHNACKNNYTKNVRLLLEYGADPNAETADNSTPLQFALEKKNAEIVRLLLNYGADLAVTNGLGSTAFRHAALYYSEKNIIPTPVDGIYPVVVHLLKQIAASIHVSPYDSAILRNDIFLTSLRYVNENFVFECEEEIKKMKTTCVPNSSMTFYDVLTASGERLVEEVANADFVEALCCVCTNCRKKFVPVHYEDMIIGRINVAKIRRRFLQRAYSDLQTVFPKLPNKCVVDILKYLTNEDCHSLRKALFYL